MPGPISSEDAGLIADQLAAALMEKFDLPVDSERVSYGDNPLAVAIWQRGFTVGVQTALNHLANHLETVSPGFDRNAFVSRGMAGLPGRERIPDAPGGP